MKQFAILFILFISTEIWAMPMAEEGKPILQTGYKHHDQGIVYSAGHSAKRTKNQEIDQFQQRVQSNNAHNKRVIPQEFDAFTTIEAESFDEEYGQVYIGDCSDPTTGGLQADYLSNGDWLLFNAVDFQDGAYRVELRVATRDYFADEGLIYLRLNSTDGDPIAIFETHKTVDYTWVTLSEYTVSIVEGIHDLYFTFESNDPSSFIADFNWFQFYKD